MWLVCCLQFAMLQETPKRPAGLMLPLPWERITITNVGLAAVKLDSAPADAWRAHYF